MGKRFGDTANQRASKLALSTGALKKVYIAGSYSGTPSFGGDMLPSSSKLGWYIASLDGATGSADWVVGEANDSSQIIYSEVVQAVAYSAPYLFAVVQGTLGGPVLHKFSSGGVEVSTSVLSTALATFVASIDVASNGDLLIAGAFSGNDSFAGGGTITSAGGFDGYVARVTTDYAHVWSTEMGGTGEEWIYDVAERADGSIVVVGTSSGTFAFGSGQVLNQGGLDGMVLSLTSGGIASSAESIGGAGDDYFIGVAGDASNDVIAGYSDGNVTVGTDVLMGSGGEDALVVKLSSATLVPIWALRAGDVDDQQANGVAVDALGRIVLGGQFKETMSLGTVLTSAGNEDAFLVQMSP